MTEKRKVIEAPAIHVRKAVQGAWGISGERVVLSITSNGRRQTWEMDWQSAQQLCGLGIGVANQAKKAQERRLAGGG